MFTSFIGLSEYLQRIIVKCMSIQNFKSFLQDVFVFLKCSISE